MKSKNKMLAAVMSAMMCMSTLSFVGCGGKSLQHVDAVDATCTTAGHTEYYTGGGKYYSDASGKTEITYESTVIPALGHTAETEWSTSDAQHWHDCSVCGKPADEKQAHTFGGWIYDVPPTDTAPGEGHKACTSCEFETVKETIPPTGGGEITLTHVPALSATCERNGNIEYWTDGVKFYSDASGENEIRREDVITDRLPHAPEAEWSTSDAQHWHDCSVCGKPADEKQAHVLGGWIYDKQPTATETGLRHKECDCGYATEPETVPTVGTVTHHPSAASTCTVKGNIEYWEKDGLYYGDAECTQEISGADTELPLDADNHAATAVWDCDDAEHWHKCPDCNAIVDAKAAHEWGEWQLGQDGATRTHTCCDCGYTSEPETVEATRHPANAATCTAGGNIEYWERGGKYYSDAACINEIQLSDTVTQPLGHDLDADDSVFSDGKFYKQCKRGCGHSVEVGAYADRKVRVNDVEYTPFTCYDDEHKGNGVTYNAVKQRFVIDPTKFADGLNIAGDNNEVTVKTDVDAVVAFVKFTNGFRTLETAGSGTLTVTGKFDSQANPTVIGGAVAVGGEFVGGAVTEVKGSLTVGALNCDGKTVNIGGVFVSNGAATASAIVLTDGSATVNGTLKVGSLTVGDAAGEKRPVLNVKANNGSGISNAVWGAPAADYKLLGGTVNVVQGGGGWTGMDLSSGSIFVGGHGALNVSGFDNGFYQGSLDVVGKVKVYNCKNGLNSVDAEVNGGVLEILSGEWGVIGGALALNVGKATIMRSGGQDFAAFNGLSKLTVADGFELGIKNLSQLMFGMSDASAIDIGSGVTVAIENIKNFADSVPSGVTVNSEVKFVTDVTPPSEISDRI